MKKSLYILNLFFFLFYFGMNLEATRIEANALETKGLIEFSGVYESVNDPDPPPNLVEPTDSKNPERDGMFPKTNSIDQSSWIGIGFFLIILALSLFVSSSLKKSKKKFRKR